MYRHLYIPFGTFTQAETNFIKLEKVQRAVVRKVYYFAWTDNEWNVQEIQHRQYQRRAIKLTEKYIYKDYGKVKFMEKRKKKEKFYMYMYVKFFFFFSFFHKLNFSKDYHSNIIIIKEMINECNILSALDESLFLSSVKKETILGTLKAHKMNFNSLLNATTQLEQMDIYQQTSINSTTS